MFEHKSSSGGAALRIKRWVSRQILLGTFHWAFLPCSRLLEKSYVHYGFLQPLYTEPAVHVEAQLQKSSVGTDVAIWNWSFTRYLNKDY